MSNPRSRRQRVVERRRRAFLRLLAAAAVTLVLGLIPPLRALLIAHVVLDVALIGFVVWLRHTRSVELQRREVLRRLPTTEPPAAPGAPEGERRAESL